MLALKKSSVEPQTVLEVCVLFFQEKSGEGEGVGGATGLYFHP